MNVTLRVWRQAGPASPGKMVEYKANDPGGRVNEALCLAVDPDLLVTVNAMSGGYVVADHPADRARYQELKLRLERENTDGIGQYLASKAPFIDAIVAGIEP